MQSANRKNMHCSRKLEIVFCVFGKIGFVAQNHCAECPRSFIFGICAAVKSSELFCDIFPRGFVERIRKFRAFNFRFFRRICVEKYVLIQKIIVKSLFFFHFADYETTPDFVALPNVFGVFCVEPDFAPLCLFKIFRRGKDFAYAVRSPFFVSAGALCKNFKLCFLRSEVGVRILRRY